MVDDEYICIMAQKDGPRELEISLFGSGFLQVLEIFSPLKFPQEGSGLQILLIDEPDSHMHADIQIALLNVLKRIQQAQIYIITHNDRYINLECFQNIYFINQRVKNSRNLPH